MKKSSAYARKRRHLGPVVTFNGAEWLNTVNAARSYSDAPVPCLHSTQPTATRADLVVQLALQGLLDAQPPTDPEHDHDVLAHALGVTFIRALQIQPSEGNPLLPTLQAGNAALQRSIDRYKSHGAWGLDGPAQMEKATRERIQILNSATRSPSENL